MEELEIQLEAEPVLQCDNEVLIDNFYNQKYYLSPSALSKFLWRPRAWFEWYVLNKKEDKDDTKATIEGSLVHLFMLEPHKFDDKYVIELGEIVSGTPKKIIDKAWSVVNKFETPKGLSDYPNVILALMIEESYYQSLKEDSKRLEKVITPAAEKYWEFLKKRSGKRMISQETKDYCKNAANLIASEPKYRKLLGLDKAEGVEVFNEVMLSAELEKYSFGLKGGIDNLVIDHNEKVVKLNDIKTTSKTLDDFKDSVEYYGYDNQIITYGVIVSFIYKALFESGYKLESSFIVITSQGDTYSFLVSENTLTAWLSKFNSHVKEFEWCFSSRNFSNFKRYVLDEYVL